MLRDANNARRRFYDGRCCALHRTARVSPAPLGASYSSADGRLGRSVRAPLDVYESTGHANVSFRRAPDRSYFRRGLGDEAERLQQFLVALTKLINTSDAYINFIPI